eukprot:TRINITY_DN314_c0_g1_i1.p1 TRINITY_DN314_c0_g1~~TRINITY_DN314_c0_g1_i1.p1  ORF type:complete len:143 (-),score=39.53 TRINITY_DN314_c0_g1_i1:149-577(-)
MMSGRVMFEENAARIVLWDLKDFIVEKKFFPELPVIDEDLSCGNFFEDVCDIRKSNSSWCSSMNTEDCFDVLPEEFEEEEVQRGIALDDVTEEGEEDDEFVQVEVVGSKRDVGYEITVDEFEITKVEIIPLILNSKRIQANQ